MEKIKNHTLLAFTLKSTDRAAVRAEVFQHWIDEKSGSSTVRNTYRYNVERLSDGSLIYLTRPTRLNKGADFVIHCEGFTKFKNGNDKPPSHGDLFSELESLIAAAPKHRTEILTALTPSRRYFLFQPMLTLFSNKEQIVGDFEFSGLYHFRKIFKSNFQCLRLCHTRTF
jgi:hypothetical protein